ncbi:phage BR0599 family protein [Azomonas macrocytogenes]|uniref:Putative phage protein (TIGR02218 family) n=1 Tax=Azomonas macrocytogenes TaxID=69962 RepID=A0A839T771_AZOMA|nr:phage BR0599 family protein [Azomonas macrocytogenes]MBB3103805.1 putative phage protein (TIGR02218 family) [Azomonas macrocytogenes]
MSFDSAERSLAAGRPIRLYQFMRNTQFWGYTSCDRDIVHQTRTFRTLRGGISDSGVRQTGQTAADELTLEVPADLEVAQLYRGPAPSSVISLTIFARHYGVDDYIVIWAGEISSVSWPALDRCSIKCSPITQRMDMQGLRLGWERNCPHALYSVPCGVDMTSHRVDSTIQSLDGADLSNGEFAAYPDGHFTAGLIEWAIGAGEYERRSIERHIGSTLTILGGTAGLSLNQAIRVYPGCAQTTAACQAYDNLANYGGIPHLAGESPYDGNNYF